jgi:lipopolysaccharide export system protein LptA
VKWQRAARLGLAVAGVTTAAALYLFTRERPVEHPPRVSAPADPAATSQSGAGVEVRFVNDVERYRLEYTALRVYPDRVRWEGAHMILKDDGTEIWAGQVEATGVRGDEPPSTLDMSKGVRLRTGEGATVEGDEARYDDNSGLTRIPGPVKFSRGRFAGSGTGAVYERHAGVFRILADARVVSVPAGPAARGTGAPGAAGPTAPTTAEVAESKPNGGAAASDGIEATSATLVFNRAANALLLEGKAEIKHGTDTMTAERATLYLADDGERFRVIELRENARVVPDPAGGSSTPDMRARDIDLAFYEGTETLERSVLSGRGRIVMTGEAGRRVIEGNVINLSTAPDGRTLTHLEAHDAVRVEIPASDTTPARVITSTAVVATGTDAAGLTDATFSGGTRFVETLAAGGGRAAGERSGSARTLVLKLKGQLETIDEAVFQQNVSFRDGAVRGDADLGTYQVSAGRLRLEPDPRTPRLTPVVYDADLRVEAARVVEIDLNTHDVHAVSGVKTTNAASSAKPNGRGAGATRTEPAVFGGEGTMYGFGDEFWYDRAKQTVRYRGTPQARARIKQGESDVEADQIDLDDRSEDLTAIGKVTSTMPIDGEKPSPGAKLSYYVGEADRMVYRDADRTVTYVGLPAVLRTPDGETKAAEVVLTLMAEARKLDRLKAVHDPRHPATQSVVSMLADGQQALSESLVYEAVPDLYTFRGGPFVLRTRNDDGTCSETRANFGTYTPGKGLSIPEGRENPAQSRTEQVACSSALKP